VGGRTNLSKTPFLVLLVILILASIGTTSLANAQLGTVPDWFKGVAGFWAEGKLTTQEFLDGIKFLIDQGIISVPGYIQAAEAQSVDKQSLDEIWSTINSLQDQVDNIQLIPGPEGPQGPIGEQGSKGERGIKGNFGDFSTYLKEIPRTASNNKIEPDRFELECDEGDIALSGGFTGPPEVHTSTYLPSWDENQKAVTGWTITTVDDHHKYGSYSLLFWVYCLEIPEKELLPEMLPKFLP